MQIRSATAQDVEAIYHLIGEQAAAGQLLPRSYASIVLHLPRFIVVDHENHIIGTAALHLLDKEMGEIRSLVLDENFRGQGVGKKLVQAVDDLAQSIGLHKVVSFTRQVAFFQKCGYVMVEKAQLPQKFFLDCIGCEHLMHCDEIALEKVVGPSGSQREASALFFPTVLP
ncbi:MAG: N-acetyltransferase [Firmicutes bacterium]|nr:N-acetyltransferase [Bacillota bacterium]